MKECTLHRDAVVRFGPYHDRCPLCKLLEAARVAESESGLHGAYAADRCVAVEDVERILDLAGEDGQRLRGVPA